MSLHVEYDPYWANPEVFQEYLTPTEFKYLSKHKLLDKLPDSRWYQLFDKFMKFDESKPEVWQLILEQVGKLMRRGFKNYSIGNIMGYIRYETDTPEYVEGQWKLNASHSAFYARKFLKDYPKYSSFFRYRVQESLLLEKFFVPGSDEDGED